MVQAVRLLHVLALVCPTLLKLFGFLRGWSWWVVTAPLWLSVGLILAFVGILALGAVPRAAERARP